MAEFIKEMVALVKDLCGKLLRGELIPDGNTALEAAEFLGDNYCRDIATVKQDTIVSVVPAVPIAIVRYQTTKDVVVTMLSEVWAVKFLAVFVGTNEHPFERRKVFKMDDHDPVRDRLYVCFINRFTTELKWNDLELLRSLGGVMYEEHYMNIMTPDEPREISRIFVRKNDIGPWIGVGMNADENIGIIEGYFNIPNRIEHITITRSIEFDGYDDDVTVTSNHERVELLYWRSIGSTHEILLDSSDRNEIIERESALLASDEWVDIAQGFVNRVTKIKKYRFGFPEPMFEEPDTVLPLFEKITATPYTKKKLSTL